MIVDSLWLLLELALLFFGVAFAIHLIQGFVGPERLRSWMGGRPIVAAIKGIAIGFVTPFCTYSAIPVLVGFRKAGVSPAGYVAFIAAAPVLDPVLFGALLLIVGAEAAFIYGTVAFCGALALALVAEKAGIQRRLKPLPNEGDHPDLAQYGHRRTQLEFKLACDDQPERCGSDTVPNMRGSDADSWSRVGNQIIASARAAVSLLRSVAVLLVIGVGIGLAIQAIVSPDTVARLTGQNSAFAIPIAAALGTPLYFDTTLFVPIADSLAATGFGVGAIVALTIAGSGANIPEFIILRKLFDSSLIALFFGYVFSLAVVGGVVAQLAVG